MYYNNENLFFKFPALLNENASSLWQRCIHSIIFKNVSSIIEIIKDSTFIFYFNVQFFFIPCRL